MTLLGKWLAQGIVVVSLVGGRRSSSATLTDHFRQTTRTTNTTPPLVQPHPHLHPPNPHTAGTHRNKTLTLALDTLPKTPTPAPATHPKTPAHQPCSPPQTQTATVFRQATGKKCKKHEQTTKKRSQKRVVAAMLRACGRRGRSMKRRMRRCMVRTDFAGAWNPVQIRDRTYSTLQHDTACFSTSTSP